MVKQMSANDNNANVAKSVRDKANLIGPEASVSALVAGDKVTISHGNDPDLTGSFRRFAAVTIVTATILVVALGYETLQSAMAVLEVKQEVAALESLRVERTAILDSQHMAQCKYSRELSSILSRLSKSSEQAHLAEIAAQRNVSLNQAQLLTWQAFDQDIVKLGSDCADIK